MNRTFKIVGRYLAKEHQQSWCYGKPNTQAKKRVYTSKQDFDRYAPETIERWKLLYKVEVFELIDDTWKEYHG